MFRFAAALAGIAVVVVPATAGATTTPQGTDADAAFDLGAPFWGAASAQCTEVLNNHLDPVSGATDVVIEVLQASAGDEPPPADMIAGWTDALTADVGRSDAIRQELADFVVVDPAYAELWDTVVSAADEGVDTQRTRQAALETGDWPAILDGFRSTMGEGGGIRAEAFATIDASPLRGSDCAVVHTWRMPDDEAVTPEFVTSVTDVCVAVANRRLSSTFRQDYEVSLNFLAEVIDADGGADLEIPADLGDALDRIVAEWELTAAGLAAIDPDSAPSAESWSEIVTVPAERLAMFEARRDAVASGDAAAVAAAYDRSHFSHSAWDWAEVGLDRRICTGLQH